MIVTALIFFSIAALMGLYLISFILKTQETPKGLVMLHGSMGAIGIIALITLSFYALSLVWASLTCFVLAALGGFYMFSRDIFGKSLPKWLAIGHGFIAIIGFLLLLRASYLMLS